MDAIEHLETHAWKTPRGYGGFSPVGDYRVMSRTRDAILLENINWYVACEELKAQAMDEGRPGYIPADRPAVYHFRANHWAHGWVEHLMVRADAPDEIKTAAGEILCALEDDPILDDQRYLQAEHDAVYDAWEQASIRQRIDYLEKVGLSFLAARHDALPEDNDGRLYEQIRQGL